MTLNLTTLNSRTSITNNPPPAAPACGLNETGICCKESETAHCLAFFWFTDSRPAAPGVAAPAWIGDVSAFGSMHHVAFKVDADQVERYRDVLKQRGVKCAAVAHYLDGSMGETVDDDTFAYSIYFQDPDGITIEFCAWLPAYDKIGNQHQPVQALTPTPA